MISLQYKFEWIDSQYESILEIPISHVLYCVVEVFPFNGKWQFRFNKRNGVGNFETKLEAKIEVENQIKKFIEFYISENNNVK